MQMERDRHGASATAAAASPPRNSTGFVGPFAHIRKKLDYSYHSCYTKERQWLQDSIIDDILGDIITRTLHATQDAHSILEPPDSVCTDPTNPWILFTAGVQGAGKFHAVRTLVQEGYLPLLGFIHVDTDRIRRMLPDLIVSPYTAPHHHEDTARPLQHQSHSESEAHMEHVTTTTTTDASDSTEKEAGYIAEIVTWAALYGGKNVILDAAMKNVGWYQRLFADLRAFFPSLRLALLHIIAPREAVFQWSMKVAMETKRILPMEDIQQAMEDVPRAVQILKQQVDFFCEILNSPAYNDPQHSIPGHPVDWENPDPSSVLHSLRILDMSHLPMNWNTFQTNFLQKCAWIPKKFKNMDTLLPNSTSESSLHSLTPDQKKQASKDALLATFTPLRATFIQPFSVHISTEDNYSSIDSNFYGPYAYLRKTLDYSYHKNYKRERQVLQDAIIHDAMATIELTDVNGDVCTTPTEPFLVFTAGAMGAGKSFTIHHLQKQGRFPLLAFVRVDPDEIRRHLPEFSLYANHNPSTAGELTRKESGYVAEIMTLAALEAGKNVIVDGSLRDHEWYKIYFSRLRQEYPLLKLAILHICAPRQAVFARAADRALKTGRLVPKETLEMALHQVPQSVKILSPLVDYFCELWNSPDADDIELLTPGITWESFTNQWRQTCAWIPRRKISVSRT